MYTASLKKPAPLKKGDQVAITAPASPVSASILEKAVRSIYALDLVPIVMPSCHLTHGYLAGPDAVRADDLNRAFMDPDIAGIFCLRGGYGTMRILPLLDLDAIRSHPKIFVGYSDITALHIVFNQLCGFITFHGPMPNTGYDQLDSFSLESLRNCLFSKSLPASVENPPDHSLHTLYPGKASGILTGGNLSLLSGTLGSPYEIDTRGKILFLEEVGERPYRLDRGLTALSLAGKFRDCAGIILGTFTDCLEPPSDTLSESTSISDTSLSLSRIIHEVILPWKKPVISNFQAGHSYPQSTLPLGSFICFPDV